MGASLRRRSVALATGAALLAGTIWALPQAASAAEAEPTGTITGTVTGDRIDEGYGVATAWRYVGSGADGDDFETHAVPIATDGSYTIGGLSAGSYSLGFNELGYDDGDFVSWTEWWDDATTFDAADPVVVVGGGVTRADADVDLVGGATSDPVISGTPKVGQTLRTSAGVWPAGTEYFYAWFADDELYDVTEVPTVVLGADARGARMSVEVYGDIDATGAPSADVAQFKVSAATAKVSAGTLTAATPTVSGTAAVGSTLTAKPGAWSKNTSLSYQWHLAGTPVKGATSSAWKLPSSAAGKPVTVKVTGKKAGYTTVAKTSKPTAKVAIASVPVVSGVAAVGSTVTAKPGRWSTSTRFSYQWSANGKKISGATASTYKIGSSAAGKKLTVTVTGRKSGYATVSKTSAATTKVAIASTPTISGTAKVGKKLTAKPGHWSSSTRFSYQWSANGKKIPGATASTYTIGSSIKGKKVTVTVTGRKAGYATVTKTSRATATVTSAPAATPKPKPSGSAKPVSASSCPSSHPIKGNHGAEDWIYHVPGSTYYSRTNPEECFATRADAERAGYRAPKR